MLAVEALGASSVLLYGLCIVRRLPGAERAAAAAGVVAAGTHVHVLVPCYTESLAIVAETVWAAADADLPAGAESTVWLLDDGADPAKKEWVEGLNAGRGGAAAIDVGARVRYLTGRAQGKERGQRQGRQPEQRARAHFRLEVAAAPDGLRRRLRRGPGRGAVLLHAHAPGARRLARHRARPDAAAVRQRRRRR